MDERKLEEQKLRQSLVNVSKMLFDDGLVMHVAGNISTRIPGTDRILIKPTGYCMGELKPEDFVTIDQEGKKIEGKADPSSETPIHVLIHKRREDADTVLHTHSVFATCFGIAGKGLSPVYTRVIYETPELAKGVPVVKYTRPGTWELAKAVVAALQNKNAVILQNHGTVIVGQGVEYVARLAYNLEELAKMQFIASLIGRPIEIPQRGISQILANVGKYGKMKVPP